MPDPRPGEGRDEFASRCIPIVMNEAKANKEPMSTRQAAGRCYGIWDNAHKEYSGDNE